jgi:hypothetical protein
MDDQTSEQSMMAVQVHPNIQLSVLISAPPAELMLLLLTTMLSSER